MLPYFDTLNLVRWLNEKLGTRMTVPEFLATWTDYDVHMHMHYFDVVEDPAVQEAMKFHEQKRAGKGFRLLDGGKDDAG